jgi:uncharacterized protein
MKYLLLLVLLAAFFFFLGVKRSRPREPESRSKPPSPAVPKAMLRCAECGMHWPADEALPGKCMPHSAQGGVFCSTGHRNSFEARQGQG